MLLAIHNIEYIRTPHIVAFLAILQGILFSIYILFKNREKIRINLFLSIFIIAFSLDTVTTILIDSYLIFSLNFWTLIGSWSLVLAPALYLYIRNLLFESKSFGVAELLHFVPAIIQRLFYAYIYFGTGMDYFAYQRYLQEIGQLGVLQNIFNVETYGFYLQSFIYIFLIFKVFNTHKSSYESTATDYDSLKLKWLKGMLIMYMTLVATSITYLILNDGVPYDEWIQIHWVYWAVILVLLYGVSYTNYLNSKVYEMLIISPEVTEQAKSVLLDVDVTKKLYVKIIHIIESELLYVLPDLKIQHIAEKLDSNNRYISYAVNRESGYSFSDLINKYRVEAFVQKLKEKENDNKTLLHISMEVGFNSKSSFNNAFKKFMHVTPAVYRRNLASS